ncbi:MAG: OsmC family protein [Planctomycetaceae bacterium]|nr:OsmC family protein [Planctomycetaceae bacterium]
MIQARIGPDSYKTSYTNERGQGTADLPVAKGGAGSGFGPHELVESALATCIVMTARMIAVEKDWKLDQAECDVRLERHAADQITLHYDLRLTGPTEEQIRMIERLVDNCPVAKTLRGTISIQAVPNELC